MFATMRTLFAGANARMEERVRDEFSIELIDQKIREAENNLKTAKLALASLIQREKSESRQIAQLETKVADLTNRAEEALDKDREDLATQAAQAIADMQNELKRRRETVDRLEARIMQLRSSVETAHRRIMDLKQGAISARAVRREQGVQKRLVQHLGGNSAMDEADTLIKRVLGADDPFEQGEILQSIDRGLEHGDIADQMADAGIGNATKATAAQVLAALKADRK